MQHDQSTIQRPQLTANMNGWDQMKLSDEIDESAYAYCVVNPAPDQQCVENWKKLDPSGKWLCSTSGFHHTCMTPCCS